MKPFLVILHIYIKCIIFNINILVALEIFGLALEPPQGGVVFFETNDGAHGV